MLQGSLMHSPSISQGRLIGSLNQFFNNHTDVEHRLSSHGVCLPLSLGFAFMHLLPHSETYGPDLFHQFLKKMSSEAGINEFFKAYQSLTLDYQQAHIQKNFFAQQEAQKKLQPYWNQLALIDLLLLVYADRTSHVQRLPEGEMVEEFAINGVIGTINPTTMTAAGLKVDGAMSCNLKPCDLQEFFLGKHSLFSSKVAPFKRGGTYLVTLPRHACAVHVTLEGKVKFYDPNYKTYISEPAELKSYEALFAKYIDKGDKTGIPVEVFAVSLLENDLKNKVQNKKIEKRLGMASDCFLKKYFDPNNYRKMLAMGMFRTLFYSKTPFAKSQLRQILSDCEKNNMRNFWDLIDRHSGLSQPLIFELFHAVHKTRNFEILKLVFAYKSLNPHKSKYLNFVTMAVRLNDLELLSVLIELYPEKIILSGYAFELARAHSYKNEHGIIEMIIANLINGKISLPEVGTSEDPLMYVRTSTNSDMFAYALEVWSRYNQTYGFKRSYHIKERSLLSWMMDELYTPAQIDAVIKAGGYMPDDTDYRDIIHGGSIALKRSLLAHTKAFHNWEEGFPCTPMEACLEARDFEFLKDLLNEGLKPKITVYGLYLIPQCFVRGDFDVLRLLTTGTNTAIELPEVKASDQKLQKEKIITLQKITLKQPLTQRESQIFGCLFNTLVVNESNLTQDILKNAIAYSWPLETAICEDGRSLVEHWLLEKRWDHLIKFAVFFQETDLLDKNFVRAQVMAICQEKNQGDMSGLVTWIQQSRFSWSDLFFGDKQLIKTLRESITGSDSYGITNVFMAKPSSNYKQSIIKSFQTRLEILQDAKTPEDLQNIISDLHCIKELIQVSGAGQQDEIECYPAVIAAIDEITALIPRVAMENMDVPTLVETVFMTKTVAQEQELYQKLPLAEELQLKQVSQLILLWDFVQKRPRDL